MEYTVFNKNSENTMASARVFMNISLSVMSIFLSNFQQIMEVTYFGNLDKFKSAGKIACSWGFIWIFSYFQIGVILVKQVIHLFIVDF